MTAAHVQALNTAFGVALEYYANAEEREASVIMLTAAGEFLDAATPLTAASAARQDYVNGRTDQSPPLAAASGVVNALLLTISATVLVMLILAALGVIC